jgi:hypothetical protein
VLLLTETTTMTMIAETMTCPRSTICVGGAGMVGTGVGATIVSGTPHPAAATAENMSHEAEAGAGATMAGAVGGVGGLPAGIKSIPLIRQSNKEALPSSQHTFYLFFLLFNTTTTTTTTSTASTITTSVYSTTTNVLLLYRNLCLT